MTCAITKVSNSKVTAWNWKVVVVQAHSAFGCGAAHDFPGVERGHSIGSLTYYATDVSHRTEGVKLVLSPYLTEYIPHNVR
jgi:hypothetical protein